MKNLGGTNLQKTKKGECFNTSNIQTGPFATFLGHFALINFHFPHLHNGRPFLITPDG